MDDNPEKGSQVDQRQNDQRRWYAELQAMELSWGEAQAAANDRTRWKNIALALCANVD